jgi:hypothetical protein
VETEVDRTKTAAMMLLKSNTALEAEKQFKMLWEVYKSHLFLSYELAEKDLKEVRKLQKQTRAIEKEEYAFESLIEANFSSRQELVPAASEEETATYSELNMYTYQGQLKCYQELSRALYDTEQVNRKFDYSSDESKISLQRGLEKIPEMETS